MRLTATARHQPRVVPVLLLVLLTMALHPVMVRADPDTGDPGDASGSRDVIRAEQVVEVTPARIDGDDRFDTAAITAEITFDTDTTTAVVARDDAFPDALAGAAAAGAEDAPVLLVERDEIPDRTREVLSELAIDRIVIVGGGQAIGPEVEEELTVGREVVRLAGDDRYATAAAVGRHIAERVGVGELAGDQAALVTSGERFPDALAAGPLSYSGHLPILLTRRDRLEEETRQVLTDLGIERVVIVGGTAAVSGAVETAIAQLGIVVERLGGDDRSATAALLADRLVDERQYAAERPMLARGDAFPDALAAGPRGGAVEAPLLLTRGPEVLSDATRQWLAARCPGIEAVQAVGGSAAVAISTLGEAVDAAESCADQPSGDPVRTITYETGTQGTVAGDFSLFQRRAHQALNDGRGWSLGGDIAFVQVEEGGDFRLWLASPAVVAGAAPVCSAEWSCRVGDDVYINDDRFRLATATYAARSLTSYQWYVVNHEVGHWLGLDHRSCPGGAVPAPVMQQQSISLDGCTTNVWPVDAELDLVRQTWLP